MLKAVWIRTGLQARQPANPAFPDGVDVDAVRGQKRTCNMTLDYPAPGIGYHLVECERCGLKVGVTTAGRADDPRSIRVPCKPRKQEH